MTAEMLVARVTAWAGKEENIRAAALVGSYARGVARPDSDIDLCLVCRCREGYLKQLDWVGNLGPVQSVNREEWGACASLRVYFAGGLEAELGFVTVSWLALPLDEGTRRVLSDGFLPLCDKDGTLSRAAAAL